MSVQKLLNEGPDPSTDTFLEALQNSDCFGFVAENLVAELGHTDSDGGVFALGPRLVPLPQGLVHAQVVSGHVGDHLLLEFAGVSRVGDAVLDAQGFELRVPIQAVLDGFGQRVRELLNEVLQPDQVAHRPFGCLVQQLSDEFDCAVGRSVIEAGHHCCRVRQFVGFEQAVQELLQNLLVTQFRGHGLHSQDGVPIRGRIPAHIVVLARFPAAVESPDPFVHRQVVQSDIGDDFFLDGAGVGLVVNSVLFSELLQFGVDPQAVLDGFGKRVSELLDQILEADEVTDRPLGGFVEQSSHEDNCAVSTGIVKALNHSAGVRQLVLFEEPIESLLQDFFIGQRMNCDCQKETENQEVYLHSSTSLLVDY